MTQTAHEHSCGCVWERLEWPDGTWLEKWSRACKIHRLWVRIFGTQNHEEGE